MIKFTDGKKVYIWNDNDEIIGMDKNATEILKMNLHIADMESFGYLPKRDVFREQGFTILEDNESEEETEEDKYFIY